MWNNLRRIKNAFYILIVLLFLLFILSRGNTYTADQLTYGLTFSNKQAQALGFSWQEIYISILDDLKVKKLRLPAYWDEVEGSEGNFSWSDLDWQINEAEKRNAEVILAIGGRLPRWPECHYPNWSENMDEGQREAKLLNYIERVINHFKDKRIITAWQIENEPFLPHFGVCPKLDKDLLDKEIAKAKSLDSRPIVVTDSGELSVWVPAAKRADIFGTTMYRDTYSNALKSYVHYPITPAFFRFKKNLANLFAWPNEWIVIELQAEPWGPVPYQEMSQADRDRTMNLKKFKDIIEFSRQTGFNTFYLWGVEWWYWEMSHGNADIWNYAKTLFNK